MHKDRKIADVSLFKNAKLTLSHQLYGYICTKVKQMNTERIEIQSYDLYEQVEKIHRHPAATVSTIRAKYILLFKVLENACYELTAATTLSFANLFSRLDYICNIHHLTPSDKYAIQTMRRNCNAAFNDDFVPVMEEYLYDLRALVRFISLTFEEDIPASLLPEIPHSNRPYKGTRHSRIPYLRVAVTSWNEKEIFAVTDSEDNPFIIIDYSKGGYQGDLSYLSELLTENLQLNLLDVHVDEHEHYIPNQIVIHPDYLIDISALAACFREYGHHPLNYFMNRIKPRANTAPILMGNLAGQFLDDYINEQPEEEVSYKHSLKKFFAANALEFCTCPIPADFHAQAQTQMMNIRSFIHTILPHNIPSFNKQQTLLEASFICEQLGLQGRVDMLQKDFKVLIEQKSGKRDDYHRKHKEDHFVQMMLYQGVLMYNFGKQTEDMQTFLLYSKYTDGLMIEHFAERLFREAIQLRNYIVSYEMAFGEGAIAKVTEELSTDLLNVKLTNSRLWNDFQEPQLDETIHTLKRCTPLEKAYFQRFYTFISKETILQKTGGKDNPANGFAGIWHIPLAEKIESGNILLGLRILQKKKSAENKGYDWIELSIPQQGENYLPNFRAGDIIIFYAYQAYPDVRNQILMKGNIVSIEPDRLTILLRNGQQNKDIIGSENEIFAIEHDSSDISAANGIRGLYTFLSARNDRKELLLGARAPQVDTTLRLAKDYDRFNELILKEKQASDYFLLVGPPGTGKTSCALRFMVEEALASPGTSLLLLSYTNRAVDEICGMLTESGIADSVPFIRIGNELSCDKRFVPYLLKNAVSDCQKLADIQQRIKSTPIIVGTTTAINNRPHLFQLKKFDMAIIDEASQILEPELIGILSARHLQENAIKKFVLVGDYKQLPAIALQNAEEATVESDLLQAIGLTDCRNSLFERLYKQSPDEVKSILRKQGRMHPKIAAFPNHCFYFNEQLECIPLPHQQADSPYEANDYTPKDGLDRLLLNRRMIFVAAASPDGHGNEKTNQNEACIVAAALKRIYSITKSYFDADRTVGVIVPYRNQIAMIRKEISKLGIPDLLNISIDTVERYQGSQRDVIIYSFTIHNFSQLNFLTANTFREEEFIIDRKLNVAITRARKQLILTGNPDVLTANITFYKLMEYIRQENGFVDIPVNLFCSGDFEISDFSPAWDVRTDNYALPDYFKDCYKTFVEEPFLKYNTASEDEVHIRYKELIEYGRFNFIEKPQGAKLIGEYNTAIAYTYYYGCQQYCAAKALFEGTGNWLRKAIQNVSGRVVFCNLGCEAGISALAFADVTRVITNLDLTVIDIQPSEALEKLSDTFFGRTGYTRVQKVSYPRLGAVPPSLWNAHAVLSELIVFNLSNLFDRISPREAKGLALDINQLVHARPLNHYLLIYRDDSETPNTHSYQAFCNHLSKSLRPINEKMPFKGSFYYNRQPDLHEQHPVSKTFYYEIRTNQ